MISNLKNFANQNKISKSFYIINYIIALLKCIKNSGKLFFLFVLIESLSIKEKNINFTFFLNHN